MNDYRTRFAEKLKEALTAVFPIIGIVLVLSFTIAPIPSSILLLFIFGAVLLIIGMMFFTLGAELAMSPLLPVSFLQFFFFALFSDLL